MSVNPRIGWRQLHYFIAVAEEGSISKAAARLHLSQPPLTSQIHQLEEEIGVKLFRRHAKGVELTVAGNALAMEARAIFAHTRRAVERVRQVSRGEIGTLRIGILSTMVWGPFMDKLLRYQERYPMVQWTLLEMNQRAQEQALLNHQIDIGFWRLTPASGVTELIGIPFESEPVAVALPALHRLAARKRLALADLAQESFVTLNPAISDFGLFLIEACRGSGFEPRITHTANEPITALGLVRAGAGVALLPQGLSTIAWKGVTFRPIVNPKMFANLTMFTRAQESSVVVAAFIAMSTSPG